MNNSVNNSITNKESQNFLDSLKKNFAKFAALLGAIFLIFQTSDKIIDTKTWKFIENIFTSESTKNISQPLDLKNCFKFNKMVSPETVTIKNWNSINLHFEGENACDTTLNVHIAFKTSSSAVRIQHPSGKECHELSNHKCWEEKSIDKGIISWKIDPPSLSFLKSPLSEPVKISINWIVYNAETRKRLRADKARITLLAEP